MTLGKGCELSPIPTLKRQLPSPDAWLNSIRLRQQGGKLTLIKPPELHLGPNQKSPGLNLFTKIQAADYSFANKEWTTLWRRSRQNKSTSSDQWLNRIGIISSTLHWIKEPFGLKRKLREPCTHELLQQKPTGWKPKPANNSVFIGLPEEI